MPHTAGDWVAGELDTGTIYIWSDTSAILSVNSEAKLIAYASAEEVGAEECVANARMMATAPELLAALQGLEYYDTPGRFCDHAAEPCERCQAARDAIAKATGETPC